MTCTEELDNIQIMYVIHTGYIMLLRWLIKSVAK